MSWLKKLVISLVLISTIGQSRAGLKTKLDSRKKSDEQNLIKVFSSELKCPPGTGPQFLTCAKEVFANVSDDDEKAKYNAAVCRFLDDIDSCYVIGFANCSSANVPKKQEEFRKNFQDTFMKQVDVDCSQIAKSNSNPKQTDRETTSGLSTRSNGASNEFVANGNANLDTTQTSTFNSNETFPNYYTTTSDLGSTSSSEILSMKYAAVSVGLVVTFIILHCF